MAVGPVSGPLMVLRVSASTMSSPLRAARGSVAMVSGNDLVQVGHGGTGGSGFGGGEGFGEDQRGLAILSRKAHVARGHGKPVGFTHGGRAHDGQRHVQIGDHALDDLKLLVVFFPKNSDVGLDDVEEPRDHGGHAAEVAGADFAVQHVGQTRVVSTMVSSPVGYMVSTSGRKTTATPASRSIARSRSSSRG